MVRNVVRTIEHHKETSGSAGAWNSFALLGKEADKHSAFLDSVTIHYILDDITQEGGVSDTLRNSFPFGIMFAASRSDGTATVDGDANQLETDHMISVRARPGGGGSVTLPIKHRCETNAESLGEQNGRVWLWMKNTDLTADDNLVWRFYIEARGRWFTISGL